MRTASKVELHTNAGVIGIELDEAKAPVSVANFLEYVAKGHYDGTMFHRVIQGFMIQGGGFEPGMKQKPTDAPIRNEADNGLKNDALHARDGPHDGAAFGDARSSSSTSPTTRSSNFKSESPARLGLRGVRQGRVRAGRGRRDRERATGQRGAHDDVPVVDVVIVATPVAV